MRKQLPTNFGFADSEFVSYKRTDNEFVVEINAWNGDLLRISFSQFAGSLDYGSADISDLIEETDPDSFFRRVVSRVFEKIPDNMPYRLYQFVDLDSEPVLEVVAYSVDIQRVPVVT